MIEGFEPVYDENSKILILGSFPSVVSREDGVYYGNKRNRFWNLLKEYFKTDFGDDKISKEKFLLERKIALWDVVSSCEIKGSLDADIKNPVIADLGKIFKTAKIEAVICNGKKSYDLYRRNFSFDVKTFSLPSTSPANVRFDKKTWFKAFDEVNYDERIRYSH